MRRGEARVAAEHDAARLVDGAVGEVEAVPGLVVRTLLEGHTTEGAAAAIERDAARGLGSDGDWRGPAGELRTDPQAIGALEPGP